MDGKIKLLSWDSFGEMALIIDGKEHRYQNVNCDLYFKIKALVKYRNWGACFKILNTLKKKEQDREQGKLF